MKGIVKRAASALFLLLGIATGARVMYALLSPVVPLLVWVAVLIIIYYVALGFWQRLLCLPRIR